MIFLLHWRKTDQLPSASNYSTATVCLSTFPMSPRRQIGFANEIASQCLPVRCLRRPSRWAPHLGRLRQKSPWHAGLENTTRIHQRFPRRFDPQGQVFQNYHRRATTAQVIVVFLVKRTCLAETRIHDRTCQATSHL